MEDLEILKKQSKQEFTSSIIMLLFAGKVNQEIEILSKVDLIDKLLAVMCVCELTTEGRIVLERLKRELKNKL